MARHVDAVMDGVSLSAVGPIIIQQIQEQAAEIEINYGVRPVRNGQDVLSSRRRALHVVLQTAVHELYDLKRRNEIVQAMAAWAGGSVLELSNHPGQRLHVTRKSGPALGNVRDYTSQISIDLEADMIPFWEEKMPVTASGTGTSGSKTLFIPGTADEIPVNAVFTPTGTLTALAVTAACGGITRSISLSGMSITGAVSFERDAFNRLSIKNGSTSLLRYRSEASDDDLLIPAGTATLTWSASASGSMQFSARGLWL